MSAPSPSACSRANHRRIGQLQGGRSRATTTKPEVMVDYRQLGRQPTEPALQTLVDRAGYVDDVLDRHSRAESIDVAEPDEEVASIGCDTATSGVVRAVAAGWFLRPASTPVGTER